jgi:tetratricopeptide (TPR) repeat protein
MSFIHDALKRAQGEKGGRPLGFEGVLQAGSEGTLPQRRRGLAVALTVAIAGAAVATLYFGGWLSGLRPAGTDTAARPAATAPGAWMPAPDVTRLYMDALNHQKNGEYAVAEVLYRQVIALDGRHVFAMNNLGVLYMIQGKQEAAQGLFEQAVAAKGDYAHPHYNLACIHAWKNEVDQGVKHLKAALAIKPDMRDWAAKDHDLDTLRNHPAFQSLMEKQAS